MGSIPIWQLDCRTKSFVLGVCLSSEDLEALADWAAGPRCCSNASPAVWRRNVLHAACRAESVIARRTGDLLDLRHAEVVLDVRACDPRSLAALVRETVRAGRRASYAPLLWALATDARGEARALSAIVVSESFVLGCAFVRDGSA
jgi:hypothetical protein